MAATNHLQNAESALNKGDFSGAVISLREHLNVSPQDIQSWHRLSLLEEQVGNQNEAGKAHRQCLTLAPNFAPAYIYAGAWLQTQNPEAAAAAFSIAFDIQPQRFAANQTSTSNLETALNTRHGGKLMADFLESQHRLACAGSQTISNSTWVRFEGLKQQSINNNPALFAPELFRINSVTQKPYYESSEFAWSRGLIERKQAITDELNSALSSQSIRDLTRPYLAKDSIHQGPLTSLAGSENWSALDLFRDGIENPITADLFPNTFDALSKIPTYGLTETPYEAFFSVLAPGQSIAPHYGQSNHSLTVHLALETPSQAYLEVANEKRQWAQNNLIVFDDSFLHSAHNPSDQRRIILLFSIWHPDLDKADRKAVQNTFKQRSVWLQDRKRIILDALPD